MKKTLMLKVLVVFIINSILLNLFYQGYIQHDRYQSIVRNNTPISVKVLRIAFHAKSSTTAEVYYKGKVYKNIDVSRNKISEGLNDGDFFFDSTNNTIFYKDDGRHALIVIRILFIMSLLLWFIPSKEFSLSYSPNL